MVSDELAWIIMADNIDNSALYSTTVKPIKRSTGEGDVRGYRIRDRGPDRKDICIESEDSTSRQTLCTVDPSSGNVIEMDLSHRTLTIQQLVERLEAVDKGMCELVMGGFIDHNPLDEVESRLEELEKAVNDQQ